MKRFITGIDGLRTAGVLAVILYHVAPKTVAGGYLGVLIFFVLSGYLITDSLLNEHLRAKKINWRLFFIKRIKRIYPVMLMVFLISALFFYFFQPHMLVGMRDSFLSGLFSVNNWWQIANGSSYFANFAQAANNAFKHIYFLSIEGQFYIVLALLLLILPKKKARGFSFAVVAVLSIASALAMAFLFKASDPTRVYYGTDTRIFALLIGVALAFAFRRRQAKLKVKKIWRVASIPAAFLIAAALLAAMIFLPDRSPLVYHGGMYAFSLLVALLVFLLAHPGLSANTYFSNRLFTYIGSRAYGIYLWQLPVLIALENAGVNTSLWYNIIWELLLIFGLAELSYRYIERPLTQIDKSFFTENFVSIKKIPFYALMPLALAALVVILSAPAQAKDMAKLEKHISVAQKKAAERNKRLESEAKASSHSASSSAPSSSSSAPAMSSAPSIGQISPETAARAADMPVVAVGDSVLLDISGRMQELFPKMYIDGLVGRHAADGANVLHSVPPAVLDGAQTLMVNLGVNGDIKPEDIAAIMQVAGKRPVFWVNVRVPRSWEAPDNAALTAAAKQYSNLHIIDWYAASDGHPEYFVSDGVHLTTTGITAYSNLVTHAIAGG